MFNDMSLQHIHFQLLDRLYEPSKRINHRIIDPNFQFSTASFPVESEGEAFLNSFREIAAQHGRRQHSRQQLIRVGGDEQSPT
jgi:hypothetical protein